MASYRDFLPVVSDGEWVRPSDWLALPTVTEAEEKFVGLHAVFPEGNNFCAFLFRGAYTVDWGDGVVEDFADNVKAEHEYDYSAISNATLTSRGYKQVIVTVTPQVGQNLTTINFQQRYTGQNQPYATGWLDVTGSFPNAGSGQSIIFSAFLGFVVRHTFVERVIIKNIGSATSINGIFYSCTSLQYIEPFDTQLVTNMGRMFELCVSLKNIPLFNTSNVLDMGGMFSSCSLLEEVPLFNTSKVTTMSIMFSGCSSLKTIPLFNTNKVVNITSMFSACRSLTTIPLIDFSSVTDATSMFSTCINIKSIPLFNTTAILNMNSMFSGCSSLNAIPALPTNLITPTSGQNFNEFAQNCYSLDRCQMVFARTVGFAFCQLGVDALVEIFTNLVDRSATTSATITISGNWGAALLSAGQRAIATSKNWVITG